MALPDTMAGVQLTGHRDLDKLVWNEAIPLPRPGPGEALVKIAAAGVNNTDINTRVGWYAREDAEEEGGGWSGALSFPLIQGADVCGEVVAFASDGGADGGDIGGDIALGMRVTCATNQPDPTPGAPYGVRVIGSEFDGAFAQYCRVPIRHLYDVSASPLTDIEIAALPCAHGTAYNLVSRATVGADDRVLVTDASSGVGMAAVELAKLRGAHVTGLASAAKHDAVRRASVDAVLDRSATPPAGGFTVVIDLVGGPGWTGFIEALVPGGRYGIVGAMVAADLRTIYLNDLTMFGCTHTPGEVFAELVALINGGRINPLVSKTYDLADIATAQTEFAAKTHPGKLVLIPPAASRTAKK